jgi:hypothetical protein
VNNIHLFIRVIIMGNNRKERKVARNQTTSVDKFRRLIQNLHFSNEGVLE